MNVYMQTHRVEDGETLEQIAQMYGIPDVAMLRDFHNREVPDYTKTIGWEVSPGFELFIPQKNDIDKIQKQRQQKILNRKDQEWKALQNRDFQFPFRFGIYQYEITMQEEIEDNVYSFMFEVEHFGRDRKSPHYILEINQGAMQYTNSQVEYCAEQMASDINAAVFPIQVVINERGYIEKLHNFYEIKERWKLKKHDLYEFYEGDVGKIILDETITKIQREEMLINMLNANYIWGVILRGILGKYEDGICEKEMRLLNDKTIFTVKNTVLKNENLTENLYCISLEAKAKNDAELQLKVKYILDADHHLIENADAELKNGNEKLLIKIQKTQ